MLGTIFGEQWVGQQRFTPTAQIDALHAAIKVRPRAAVLDLWCGAGGPAIYLAQQTGCRVIGIDPSVDNVRRARAAAAAAGLKNQAYFFSGTLTTIPMPTASFDAIVSHDAFFPVENKLRLLANCSRLLRPGGRMAFTALVDRDHLVGQLERSTQLIWSLATAETLHANRCGILDESMGIAQPLLTADDYRAITTLAGLHVLAADDLTASLRVVSGRWSAALLLWEEELIAELGQAPFEHLRATTGQLAEWAVQGLIGQIRLVAGRESEDHAAHSLL
jgi:SAM-dependent methyltransferase